MSIKFIKFNNHGDDEKSDLLLEIKEEKFSTCYASTSDDNEQRGVIPSYEAMASERDSSLATENKSDKPPQGNRRRKSRPKTVLFEIGHQEKTNPAIKSSAFKKTFLKSTTCATMRAPTKFASMKELNFPKKYLSDQCNSRWSVLDHRICGQNTHLLDAIEYHKNEEVDSILQDGANPNATCRAGHISACHAAAFTNGDALRLLLKHNADKNRKDKFGRTPLHLAASAGRVGTVAMLLDFPTELQEKIDSKITPLIEEDVKALRPRMSSMIDIPCEFESIAVLPTTWKDSIEHKCTRYIKLFPKFFSGWTPLHIASYAAHHNATQLLLAAGANPNSKDAIGQTPLDIAGGKLCDVDVDSYVKTIKTLIEYGGELNTTETTPPDSYSALHTAVELCSVEAIRSLVAAGAPVTHHNERGNTPLHECVAKCYKEPLQILAKHILSDETRPSIDVTNSSGYTVLHAAILASWIPGVCVALDAGADVTIEAYNGFTAIHLAARQGNFDILNELLNAAGNQIASHDNGHGAETPLLCAIRSGNLECVQKIIDAGALLKIVTYTDPTNDNITLTSYDQDLSAKKTSEHNLILHAAAEIGYVDILKFLLYHDKSLEELLDYRCPNLMDKTPVEYAALHNKERTFEFLLQKSVERAQARQQTLDPSELVKICVRATFNSESMFTKIIDLIPDAVQLAMEKGFFSLHEAIVRGKTNLVYNLIHNGADLSQSNECGKTALSMFYEHFPNPTKLIGNIFDDYICTDSRCYDVNCHTYVDYRVLIPTDNPTNDKAQLRVLKALLKTGNNKGQKTLLIHPLVESFLYLKWKTISTFFYMIIFIYTLFASSLSIYIVSTFFYCKDKERAPRPYWDPNIWQYVIYFTLCLIIIQELLYAHLTIKGWLKKHFSVEFWVKCGSFSLAIATPQFIQPDSPDEDWRRHFGTLTLVLAWLNIMMLLSKTPTSGYYMHLFWKVSTKVIKILITFSFLFIMFSACFMIQFHGNHPFDGPMASLAKTLVMMTSEFDYANTFTRDSVKKSISIQMVRVVFILFLILAAMVLMNMMIGVAVHDLQDLFLKGEMRRLEKQVEFLNRWEISANERRSLHQILGLYRWFYCKKVPQRVDVTLDKTCPYKGYIRDVVLQKAYHQFDLMEKKQEAIRNESALDEIRTAVRSRSYCAVCGSDKKIY